MLLTKLKIGAAALAVLVGVAMRAPVVAHTTPDESAPVAATSKIEQEKKERVDQHGDPLPDQALFRIGTTRLQHVESPVDSEPHLLSVTQLRKLFGLHRAKSIGPECG